MEERFIHLHGVQLMVEFLIILLCEVRRFTGPRGIDIVDDILFVEFDLFAVFPFFLLTESDLYRQELAVFVEQAGDRSILEVLAELIVDMQHDVGTALSLDGIFHRVLGVAFARPMDCLRVLFVGLREDLHFLAYHEGRIETETEMTDNGFRFVLILREELLGAGESDLVDVFIDLLSGHAYSVIRDRQGLLILIYGHAYTQIAQIAFHFADRRQRLQFLRRIYGIGNQLTQKDLMIRIQKFLDDGEYIVTRYPNITFAHSICFV